MRPPYGVGTERLEYEPDPRHVELMISQVGLNDSSCVVVTPSEKSKPGVDYGTHLNKADHTLNRSSMMRLCYLALDRLDLQCLAKALARWVQAQAAEKRAASAEPTMQQALLQIQRE